MDELNSSHSYIAVNDSNVSSNSIQELLEFSTQQAARRNEGPHEVINLDDTNVEERLVNEYDRESEDDDDGNVIYDTDDENADDNEEQNNVNVGGSPGIANRIEESPRQEINNDAHVNVDRQEAQNNQNREESVDEEEEDEEEDEEFVNPRAKMPRLHSDMNLKASSSAKEEPKKEEPVMEEEVLSQFSVL